MPRFSIRTALIATGVLALFFAALNEPAALWTELLVWLALGGVAFQSAALFVHPPGVKRWPALTSAVFGWTCLIAFPILKQDDAWRLLDSTAGHSFAIIAFSALGILAGRALATGAQVSSLDEAAASKQ